MSPTDSPPQIDWDTIVANTGLKNANTAKVRFYQIKKKLNWEDRSAAPPGSSPTKVTKNRSPQKPRTPRKPKAMKEELDGDCVAKTEAQEDLDLADAEKYTV